VTPGGAQLEFVEENGETVALQLYGIAGDPGWHGFGQGSEIVTKNSNYWRTAAPNAARV